MSKITKNVGLNPSKSKKCLVEADGLKRAARYNYMDMEDNTSIAKLGFPKALIYFRERRGVSAREMSLSLGQGASYINDIENGRSLPSMAMFFEMCEYLAVSPLEFFSYTREQSNDIKMLCVLASVLNEKDLDLLIKMAERLKK